MAKSKVKPKIEEKDMDALCPTCGIAVDYRCRLCGATKSINPVSGNVVWMRNGRLIAAFHDEKEAYIKMARQWGISEERWPEKFKGLDIKEEEEDADIG